MKVTQSCLTLFNPMDCTVHGILQARILQWVACPFSRGFFPTQESHQGLLHCRWILYQPSYQGSPLTRILVYYKRIQITNNQTEEVHGARYGERAWSFYVLRNLQYLHVHQPGSPLNPILLEFLGRLLSRGMKITVG